MSQDRTEGAGHLQAYSAHFARIGDRPEERVNSLWGAAPLIFIEGSVPQELAHLHEESGTLELLLTLDEAQDVLELLRAQSSVLINDVRATEDNTVSAYEYEGALWIEVQDNDSPDPDDEDWEEIQQRAAITDVAQACGALEAAISVAQAQDKEAREMGLFSAAHDTLKQHVGTLGIELPGLGRKALAQAHPWGTFVVLSGKLSAIRIDSSAASGGAASGGAASGGAASGGAEWRWTAGHHLPFDQQAAQGELERHLEELTLKGAAVILGK